jgi:hypothetical protein
VLCHCLRVVLALLLHPLRPTAWMRAKAKIRTKQSSPHRRIGTGTGGPGGGSQACAGCDSTAGSSGAYHLKSIESPSLAHTGSLAQLPSSPQLHRVGVCCGIFGRRSYKQLRLCRGPVQREVSRTITLRLIAAADLQVAVQQRNVPSTAVLPCFLAR